MIFKTEADLSAFAEQLGRTITPPMIFELIGDVGAGKTTFTRALAKGLGVKDPVTSPSFTISNRYNFSERSADGNCDNDPNSTPVDNFELIHYDFYRLADPGLMRAELEESLKNNRAIIILEWADSVKNLLPENHVRITFEILEDGSRNLKIEGLKNELIS